MRGVAHMNQYLYNNLLYSEPMWPIEARCAAIANTYFVACNNRVGTVSASMLQ